MAETQVRKRPVREQTRPVRIVDTDIHPHIGTPALAKRVSARWRRHLETYGRRTPIITELYPRASNAGMRADSWPEGLGAYPGSDLHLLQRQVLDEYDLDYGILNALVLLDCREPPELAAELARATNDWLVEDWLDADSRLLGAIVVPYEYPELAVREIERRAADGRWVQVIFPETAQESFGHAKYWPIYEAAAAHGLPVAMHTGGYEPHRAAGWPSTYLEEHVSYALVMQAQLVSLVAEGVFEAIPDLKVVLAEGGASWLVGLRFALDSAWELLRGSLPRAERMPSEVIREHVWFTTQPIEEPDDPRDLLEAIELAELTNRLMFATDYPHWDFDSPTQALPAVVPKDVRQKVMAGNACELYGLPHERP